MRELALFVWGVLYGAGFWLLGALVLGVCRVWLKDVKLWKRPLLLLALLPVGSGVLALPLVSWWFAWNTDPIGVDDDWLWLGFWVWPVMFGLHWFFWRPKE